MCAGGFGSERVAAGRQVMSASSLRQLAISLEIEPKYVDKCLSSGQRGGSAAPRFTVGSNETASVGSAAGWAQGHLSEAHDVSSDRLRILMRPAVMAAKSKREIGAL